MLSSEFGTFHDVLTNSTNDATELWDKAQNSTEVSDRAASTKVLF